MYKLTNEGMEIGRLIWKGLSDNQRNFLVKLKRNWQGRSLNELLHYVYIDILKLQKNLK
jgi:hypothetical protein